ncbi:23674_t:CDS:2 [Cetraspora pellucida]|uniref:23674_t:CDS:1 n=1 Tax=Cetraspora pellucida TaxID=1433469 RepID=A0A9N9A032_9GLOM|nr:23674_t:CDS:2 [Cetraspora pellucida]
MSQGMKASYNYNLSIILSDFEQQIQATELVIKYDTNKEFSIELYQIIALAFLSLSEIPNIFNQVKLLILSHAIQVVKYFEKNYIYRRAKHLRNENIICTL